MKYRTFRKLISWDQIEDALDSKVIYVCPKCDQNVSLCLREDSEGESYETDNKSLQKYLDGLSEKYFAIARSVRKQCPRGHAVDLVFVYGETQPARYVLVQAASVVPHVTKSERAIVLSVLFLVLGFYVFINLSAYGSYNNQRYLERYGIEFDGQVVSKQSQKVPKTPNSYRIWYQYVYGDIAYDSNPLVDESTFDKAIVGDDIPVLVDSSDITQSNIAGNKYYRGAVGTAIGIDGLTLGAVIAAISYSKRKRSKRS
ncbi:hypothetical protein KC959_03700 [Candidatus Saccharibacteria bacterium]|nr:hypothetical protein [Candidatus Saccharibacteria bacterium]